MNVHMSVVLALATAAGATDNSFVPACIAKQCSTEALAIANDTYTSDLAGCVSKNFGPCASDAWACLGDSKCRNAVACGPKVFDSCKSDIWAMLTQPAEREKVMCLLECDKDGKINPLCVAAKCSKAAASCLFDKTCLDAALCAPKAMMACSAPAFGCVFGTDRVCQENLQCLGHGLSECGAPGVNMLTDTKIADFITCAGSKCPHPVVPPYKPDDKAQVSISNDPPPTNVADQLLCIASKCGAKVTKILVDQDTKDLLTCALKDNLPELCSSVWGCLGDKTCSDALSCWAKPFETCGGDMWKSLTDSKQRSRIEHSASCIHGCARKHNDDFVQTAFCIFDMCGQDVVDCNHDATCKGAVQCVPNTVGQCIMPQLETYAQSELLKNSTKCVARGLELCGAGAVEMLRDANIAEAVSCAAQCTRPTRDVLVV